MAMTKTSVIIHYAQESNQWPHEQIPLNQGEALVTDKFHNKIQELVTTTCPFHMLSYVTNMLQDIAVLDIVVILNRAMTMK